MSQIQTVHHDDAGLVPVCLRPHQGQPHQGQPHKVNEFNGRFKHERDKRPLKGHK